MNFNSKQDTPSISACIHGFSLMELMIVLAIISILVAIAIPSYQTYTRRAHYAEVVQAAAPYKIGVQECFQVTSNLEDCHAGENGVPPTIESGQGSGLIQAINLANDSAIVVTPNNKYGITAKDTYILTPVIENGSLTWESGGGGVAAGYAN